MSPPLENSHHLGPIYSSHIPFHAIRESIRFAVCPVDGVVVHLKHLRKNFKEESCVLFATGAKILFRQYVFLAPCWINLGLLDYKANAFPIALAGPGQHCFYFGGINLGPCLIFDQDSMPYTFLIILIELTSKRVCGQVACTFSKLVTCLVNLVNNKLMRFNRPKAKICFISYLNRLLIDLLFRFQPSDLIVATIWFKFGPFISKANPNRSKIIWI